MVQDAATALDGDSVPRERRVADRYGAGVDDAAAPFVGAVSRDGGTGDVSVPVLTMPPPTRLLEVSVHVRRQGGLGDIGPPLLKMPLPKPATFPERTESVTVSMPLLKIPPPPSV